MQLFFDLLQVTVGQLAQLSHCPNEQEWNNLFSIAQKQCLVGVLYHGISLLPKEQHPPRPLLLKWFMYSESIQQSNKVLNEDTVYIYKYFQQKGLKSAILKGQGIGDYYETPELRTPGDIDIWVDKPGKDLINELKNVAAIDGITYLHVNFHLLERTEIEVHYRPSYLRNPWYNYRLQKYFHKQIEHSTLVKLAHQNDEVAVPTLEFNRFYILLHIYRHLFGEGIGLRQLMDYYYVLKKGGTLQSKQQTMDMFRKVGMEKFVGATMWVMKTVFRLDDKFLLCPPNAKAGNFLLNEVMKSGNFGFFDERINRINHDKLLYRVIESIKRNVRFLVSYPQEVLFDIPFRVWHFTWRKYHGWI